MRVNGGKKSFCIYFSIFFFHSSARSDNLPSFEWLECVFGGVCKQFSCCTWFNYAVVIFLDSGTKEEKKVEKHVLTNDNGKAYIIILMEIMTENNFSSSNQKQEVNTSSHLKHSKCFFLSFFFGFKLSQRKTGFIMWNEVCPTIRVHSTEHSEPNLMQ